jgi:hypothetical protein
MQNANSAALMMSMIRFFMVCLSSKENRGDRITKIFKRFTGFVVVFPTRFEGLGFGFEFAYLDQREIIPLV